MEPATDDEPSVNQRLMDVFVFAPAGLVVTALEEFPRLVERGRERLTGGVTSARTVGSFAVSAGRSQLHQRAADLRRSRAGTGPGGNGDRSPAAPDGPPPPPSVARVGAASRARSSPPVPSPGPDDVQVTEPTSVPLAIPGFDTLSASQVVQRLDGLTQDELHAVRAYEAGHRGRRTILNRVDQLLDERS